VIDRRAGPHQAGDIFVGYGVKHVLRLYQAQQAVLAHKMGQRERARGAILHVFGRHLDAGDALGGDFETAERRQVRLEQRARPLIKDRQQVGQQSAVMRQQEDGAVD
jgi:hypothetical protein